MAGGFKGLLILSRDGLSPPCAATSRAGKGGGDRVRDCNQGMDWGPMTVTADTTVVTFMKVRPEQTR